MGSFHSKLERLQDKIFFPNISNIHDKKDAKKDKSKTQADDKMELPDIVTVKASNEQLKQKEQDNDNASASTASKSDSE